MYKYIYMHIYIYIISRGYRWMGYMGWWGYHPKYLGNTKHTRIQVYGDGVWWGDQ